jgi:tetratricopeptide (TPR) repeat protein
LKPDATETRMRLGRTLGRLGRHADAAVELRQAVAANPEDDPLMLDYGELCLGAEEEALGRHDEARSAYEHAAAQYGLAQSPLIALSQLARRRGDRAGALRAIEHLFALRPEAIEREDPWWTYHVAQARNAETLLEELRKPFLAARPR